jgi:hypothetical protein
MFLTLSFIRSHRCQLPISRIQWMTADRRLRWAGTGPRCTPGAVPQCPSHPTRPLRILPPLNRSRHTHSTTRTQSLKSSASVSVCSSNGTCKTKSGLHTSRIVLSNNRCTSSSSNTIISRWARLQCHPTLRHNGDSELRPGRDTSAR